MNRELQKQIELNLCCGCSVRLLDRVDSTNRVVKELAELGQPERTVVLAEEQTAGRGRRGRHFLSPRGSGLYLSVLLRPEEAEAVRLTVLAGVAVAQAVQAVLGLELQIKWVNDLYYQNKKVCGILAEGAASGDGLSYCVLGIGLNVYAPAEGFGEFQDVAGALLGGEPDEAVRGQLAAEVLNRFFALYADLQAPSILEEYRRRSYLQGKTVTVVQGENRFRAVVQGIGDRAELLLKGADGSVLALNSGEIRLEDYR